MSSAMQAATQPSPVQVPSQYAPSSSPQSQSLQQSPASQSSHWASQQQHQQQSHNNAVTSGATVNSQQPRSHSHHLHDLVTMTSQPEQHIPSTSVASTAPLTTAASSVSRPNRPGLSDILGGPPIPPPRTSSNNKSRASSTSASPQDRTGSSRNRRREERREREDRERVHSSGQRERPKDDAPTSRSRRKAPPSPEGPRRAASTRERRDHGVPAMESRSEAAMGPSSFPTGLPKEDGTVTNRMVVTDPEVDIMREKQRQVEAQAGGTSNTNLDGGAESGDTGRPPKSRHDYSQTAHKETTFGDYILGQTLGEGEFGKVRLGWKRDGSVQVAIKLIRRETLGSNPGRLPKIHREIAILRELSHPNIVRLHEMVETDRHIGIILEYASGGELFDYILNQRYLKDHAARRLFAQLVSGVGYLHKKGIVHRDLKLENLLLDRNRNIIITDFGFANTFNPADELSEEIEYNLTNREFVKRMRLDRPDAKGIRRGDLMQTSCGSPCYAAPELVVSDSLYTGRKVDVWSCGVILYAMLAGYLPFDDDPANPDGDNINLLYKYIVTTPLTFPEYVTPHARDLLRRILVPDPRKRADLFEVARHSWLAEYASVVSHITSNTTNVADIANTTVTSEAHYETPLLTRSASVREPPKPYHQTPTVPSSASGHQQSNFEQTDDQSRQQRDAKRRTVQVEYVAPQSQTARGVSSGETFGRAPAPATTQPASIEASRTKPLPKSPPVSQGTHVSVGYSVTNRNQGMPRPKSRDVARSISELTGAFSGTQGAPPQSARPPTSGSMASLGKIDSRLPSRGSYSQPVAPAVATANAQARLAQPKSGGKPYISAPIPIQPGELPASSIGQPSTQPGPLHLRQQDYSKGHKRSSTVSSISEKLFGRPGSFFGGRTSQPGSPRVKPGKRYPPTSMKDSFGLESSRASMDSRRSLSHAFRKQSDASTGGSRQRRFSLIPPSFLSRSSTKERIEAVGPSQTDSTEPDDVERQQTQDERRLSTAPATVLGNNAAQNHQQRNTSQPHPGSSHQQNHRNLADYEQSPEVADYSAQIDRQFASLHGTPDNLHHPQDYGNGYQGHYQSEPNITSGGHLSAPQGRADPNKTFSGLYEDGYNQGYENASYPSIQSGRMPRNSVLQKNHRKFADAYEYEKSHHSGSSGAARKVMDFFRRRGKARAGEDR
ncbi:CAMK/CAMKL/KIN4 protein kinase [Coccidioides immitis RS]|uniref:non-specific serine/threonine protein kinase n=3 Tax=Coccidioides immitis TaxID=5501 RepID=J3KAZ4_COCIM|nr:CAMK/CAMKL/KIN4 protein kinase [Coccidioides immitis RS]EAS32243.3 CAMK/CAMKL/KIN4 protein kinase [Coccidioides immitis RS]